MAHLIPCNDGSRFVFSHDFSDLLVGQMEATLEGEITNVRIWSNKLNNETITWPESLADDYLHRPSEDEFENICFYDLTRRYKKLSRVSIQVNSILMKKAISKLEVLEDMISRKHILGINSVIYLN